MRSLQLLFALLLFALFLNGLPVESSEGLQPDWRDPAYFPSANSLASPLSHKQAGKQAIKYQNIPFALRELSQYTTLSPSDPEGHFLLAYTLNMAARPNDALSEYDLAESGQKDAYMDCAELRVNRGNILLKLGRVKEAESEYRRAIEVDPLVLEARLSLAQALLIENQINEAFNQLEACSLARGRDPKFLFLEAIANLASNNPVKATEWLQKCSKNMPSLQSPQSIDGSLVRRAQELLQSLRAPVNQGTN
jgi:tetratricopeptide (TPR) repeat protein